MNPFDLELSETSEEEDSPLTAVHGNFGLAQARGSLPSSSLDSRFDNFRRAEQNISRGDKGKVDTKDDKVKSIGNDGTPPRKASEVPSNLFPSISGREQSPRNSPIRTTFPGRIESNSSPASGHKTPMDVDAFKRLLLTGAKDPVPASSMSLSVLGQHGSQGDNSSNTDTSSISKNSILDSQTDLSPETPDTSQDATPLDEEGESIFRHRIRKSEPPTPPRRRGSDLGRPQSLRGHNDQPTPASSEIASSRPTSIITDSNKSISAYLPTEATVPNQPGSPLSNSFNSSSRQRVAPPPPISRRNSQMRAKQQQFHGVASSIAEETFPEPILPPPPAISKAPAPPPPRRKGTERVAAVSLDHANQSIEGPSILEDRSSQIPTKAPPPPPSRSGSKAKTSRPIQIPSIARTVNVPPPPPPRHRASSGSSYASQRASTELTGLSNESQPPSSQPNSQEDQPRATEDTKDILADLSTLQKELDAYRTTFGS